MKIDPRHAAAATERHGQTYYFCSTGCRDTFAQDPGQYANGLPPEQPTDPVCGMTVDPAHAAASTEHRGRTYWFCGTGCYDAFVDNPDPYLIKRDKPTSSTAWSQTSCRVHRADLGGHVDMEPDKNRVIASPS